MSVQRRDQPFHEDSIAVLRHLSGPVSDQLRNEIEMLLAKDSPPKVSSVHKQSDYQQFAVDCGKFKDNEIRTLRELSKQTDLLTCCSICILIAQYDYEISAPANAPNEYSHEMEFLASFFPESETDQYVHRSTLASLVAAIRHGKKAHRLNVVAALNAIKSARRIRILTQCELITASHVGAVNTNARISDQLEFSGMLANEWLTLKGLYSPVFDWQYVDAIRDKLISIGIQPPRLQSLSHMLNYFFTNWTRVHREFEGSIPEGQLRTLLIARSLESVSSYELRSHEIDLLARYARRIPTNYRAMIRQAPPSVAKEIEAWITTLCASRDSLGHNDTGSPFYPSPLTNKPVLCGHDTLLLALPHRLTTDLSNLLHVSWATKYGEKYFKTRGQVLESIAIETLGRLLPNCSSIRNAVYETTDGQVVEIDGVVAWRDVCFLIECKSGYLSLRARQGADKAATADLKDTIGDGFYQASRFLRQLSAQRQVSLRDGKGGQLILQRRKIRRAYVILPTADFLGSLTTTLERLWSNGILADGSLPLLVTIQDLLLLAEFIPTPLEFISYLDYREEVLERDDLYVVDDLEVLGSFVAGHDLIGSMNAHTSENDTLAKGDGSKKQITIVGAIQQELFIDSWLNARALAAFRGEPEPPPPRRHDQRERAGIEEMWKKWNDLESASIAHQVERNALKSAFDQINQHKEIDLMHATTKEVALIAFGPRRKFREVRRIVDVRALRASVRHVLYFHSVDGELRLRSVEYGRKHFDYRSPHGGVADSLLAKSRAGDQESWFKYFSDHRTKRYDRTTAAALQEEGLNRSLAVGISRLEVVENWRQLVRLGVSPTRAANVWLGPLSEVAKDYEVHPKSLTVSSERIRDALELVKAGELDSGDLPHLFSSMLNEEEGPAALARRLGLTKSTDERTVRQAIDAVLRDHKPRIIAAGSSRTRAKLRNELIGKIMSQEPQANARLVAQLIDKKLERPMDC